MSNNTMLFAMYRMGFHGRATVRGFRAVASTLLNEMGFHPYWIERQLAHDERNKVRAAYNRAQYLPERSKMMQQWADLLDAIKAKDKKLLRGRFGKAAWTTQLAAPRSTDRTPGTLPGRRGVPA